MPARPRPARRLALAAAVAVPLALVAAAPAPAFDPGITYDFRVSTRTGEGAEAKELAGIVGRGQVSGSRARVDIREASGPNPFTKKGTYMVVPGDARMLMVLPEEQQYYAFNMEQLAAGMGSMMKAMGGMVKMTMSDVKIGVEDLGAGEKLHGYDTRRLRMTQSFTMTVSVLGRKTVTTSADTTESWVAPALKDVVNPFLRMGNAAGAVDFGNPDYARQLKAANEKMAAGLPLRTVSRAVATDEKGKVTVTSMTMEVTNLQRGDVALAAFEIPPGYQEVPMPFAELAALGDSLEAAKARDAAAGGEGKEATAAKAAGADGPDAASMKDAAKGAAKEAGAAKAADQAKKAIRGIFKRPPVLR